MQKSQKEKHFLYENDGITCYAVLPLEKENEILHYQTEMIAANKSLPIIPFTIRQIDECSFIYFNITSKVTLQQFLKRKVLSRTEFLDISRQIARAIVDSTGYMLKPSSFLLDESFIYISPASMKLYIMYIPTVRTSDIHEDYRELIIKIITKLSDIQDEEGDNFLHKIISEVRKESFFIDEFIGFINKLGASFPNTAAVAVPPRKEVVSVEKSRNLIPMIAAQILLAAAALFTALLFRQLGHKNLGSYAGIILLMSSMGVLLVKAFKGEKRERRNQKRTKASAIDNTGGNQPVQPVLGKISGGGEAPVKTQAICENGACETVVVDSCPAPRTYLQSLGVEPPIKISLSGRSMMIGRLKEQADFILPYKTIGKVHAEIGIKEGRFYIKDMNSKNGTYINNLRISNNTCHEMKDSDVIGLADIKFVFRTG